MKLQGIETQFDQQTIGIKGQLLKCWAVGRDENTGTHLKARNNMFRGVFLCGHLLLFGVPSLVGSIAPFKRL